MKTVIKTAITAMTLSVITVGVASAMIPKAELTKNLFPDEGVSSQVLSDIDKRVRQLRKGVANPGFTELGNNSEPLILFHKQLVGKHLI